MLRLLLFLLLLPAAGFAVERQFPAPPWELTVDMETGALLRLDWKGEAILKNPAGRRTLDLALYDARKQVQMLSQQEAFRLERCEWNADRQLLTLHHAAGPWRFEEQWLLTPDRFERSAAFTFAGELQSGEAPPRVQSLRLTDFLPAKGNYRAPASFLGDSRSVIDYYRGFDEAAAPEKVAGKCARLAPGVTVGTAAGANLLTFNPDEKKTLLFLFDERLDPVYQYFSRLGDSLVLTRQIEASCHAEPGVRHDLLPVRLLLAETGDCRNALREKLPPLYRETGLTIPRNRPEWADNSILFFHPGGSAASFEQDIGGVKASEALLPLYRRYGFGSLLLWCLTDGSFPTNPGDYYQLNPRWARSWGEYRDFIRAAHREGFKVMQYFIPHGGTPAAGELRGNHPGELIFDFDGNVMRYWCFDMGNPAWQRYLAKVVRFYASFGIDGLGIDAPGSLGHNWRRQGWPPLEPTPKNLPEGWWRSALAATGGVLPPLPYARASLGSRAGAIELCRVLRDALREINPKAITLAENMRVIHAGENDLVYNFMTACLARQHERLGPDAFVPALALWLEELKLVWPEDALLVPNFPRNIANAPGLTQAFLSLFFFMRGVPKLYPEEFAGSGFLVGRLNRLRDTLPELRRGEADYLAIGSGREAVFRVLRRDGERFSVAAVNFSPERIRTTLELPPGLPGGDAPLTLWNSWTGEKLRTAPAADFRRLDLDLPPWGSAVFTWRKPGEANPCPLELPAAAPEAVPRSLACRETGESFVVENHCYRLEIGRRTGFLESFSSGNLPLLGQSRFLADAEATLPPAAVELHQSEESITITARMTNGLSLRYDCRPDEVRVETAFSGQTRHGSAALAFTAPGLERWRVEAATGILDDWFRPHTADGRVSEYAQWLYRAVGTPVAWQSRVIPQLPGGNLRLGRADGRGVELLPEGAWPNIALFNHLYAEAVPAAVFFLRSPETEVGEGPFTLRLRPIHFDRETTLASLNAAPRQTRELQVGTLSLRAEGEEWLVATPHYRLRLARCGGGIRELRDAAGKLLLSQQELRSDRGFYRPSESAANERGFARNAFRASTAFDDETGVSIRRDGDTLRLRFDARLEGISSKLHQSPVWCSTEYAFDASPAFRLRAGARFDGAKLDREAELLWRALRPESAAPFFSAFEADMPGKAPEFRFEPGTIALPLLAEPARELVPRRWYQAAWSISTVPDQEAPAIPPFREPKFPFDASFDENAVAWSLPEGKPILCQLPLAAPGYWRIRRASVKLEKTGVSLQLNSGDVVRQPLSPDSLPAGRYSLTLRCRGEGLAANGEPVREWENHQGNYRIAPVSAARLELGVSGLGAKGKNVSKGKSFSFTEESFDWKELEFPFTLAEPVEAPQFRASFRHSYGGNVRLDALRIEAE